MLAEIGVYDIEQGEPGDVPVRIAEGLAPGPVDVQEGAVGSNALDEVVGVLEEVPVFCLVFLQCLFRLLPSGNVPGNAQNSGYLVVFHLRRDHEFTGEIAAGPVPDPQFEHFRAFPREDRLKGPLCRGRVIRVDNREKALPEHFRSLPSGQRFKDGIDRCQQAVRGEGVDHVTRCFDHTPVPLL